MANNECPICAAPQPGVPSCPDHPAEDAVIGLSGLSIGVLHAIAHLMAQGSMNVKDAQKSGCGFTELEEAECFRSTIQGLLSMDEYEHAVHEFFAAQGIKA